MREDNMTEKTYGYNVTFTRPDENNAYTYTIGFNVLAYGETQALDKLYAAFPHLRMTEIILAWVMDEDGNYCWKAKE